ncbi:hypothetical protein K523DRAFT_413571 [Schizophyllum commune Tattone D]|nr:hypothetical protein K523DRAFT_413571 [Schizophyllum commune Tattone D]
MIHRSTDSRLLTSLISSEKDYCKSLEAALASGHASLASFSAYAAASPPHISTTILSVANVFIGAQDALKRYAYAVEEWKDLLTQLKGLEDDVANTIRDREILITRLIKVSKSSSTRDSILSNSSPSSSLNDLPGLGSSKLNRAQAELQACEAQLALKERELEASRTRVITQGLSIRCKGLADCGYWWLEKGKEGLNILGTGSHNQQDKPLPEPADVPIPHHSRGPSSDVSSTNSTLSPSQSASQIDIPAAIPPAHAISSEYIPSPLVSFPGSQSSHVLSRRITEESLQDNASTTSSEDLSQEIEVVENPRFTNGKAGNTKAMPRKRAPSAAAASKEHVPRERKISSSTPASPTVAPKSGFLGSIRGLFRSSGSSRASNASNDSEDDVRRPSRLRRDKSKHRAAAPNFDEPAPASATPSRKPSAARRRSVSATPKLRTSIDDRILGSGTSSLARNDSLTSAASAPATSGRRTVSASVSSPLARSASTATSHQRSGSFDDLDLRTSRASAEQRRARQERRSTVQSFPQSIGNGASTSLMSIVEDVARERREGERRESLVAKPAPKVEIADSPLAAIRAPPSLGRKELEALTTTPPRHSGLKSYSETHLVTPVHSRTPSPAKTAGPPKTPLRSALRKSGTASRGESPSSRSASPAPPRNESPSMQTPKANNNSSTRIPPNPTSPPPEPPVVLSLPTAPKFVPPEEPKQAAPPPPPPPVTNGNSQPYDDDDVSSIESYETGHESWGSESDSSTATIPGRPVQEVIVERPSPKEEPERPSTPTQSTPRPPTPTTPATLPSASVTDLPATVAPPAPAPKENGNAAPASDESAGGGAPTRRRKSVRVSLKPTFSPTPPAIEDDDHAPWSLGYAGAKAEVVNERTARGARTNRDKDLWEDSSDEEVEYATAKRMLDRLKGKK